MLRLKEGEPEALYLASDFAVCLLGNIGLRDLGANHRRLIAQDTLQATG